MAMDKLTRYFALFIGPLLVYITVTLYLKDEESLIQSVDRKKLESGDRSQEKSQMLAQNDATIWSRSEYSFMHKKPQWTKDYDEESAEFKMSREASQNQRKSEQSTKLTREKKADLLNDFVEDFSFDRVSEKQKVDPRFHKEYETEKDFAQKTVDKPFLNEDPKIYNDNKAPPTGSKKLKSNPKSSVGVGKEPDIRWCHKKRILVLILVFTQPERSYERLIARKTWIKYTPSDFAMFFVMGKPDDRMMEDVNEEFETFQDILIGNFKDQKRTETTKFMMALMWFSQLQNVCKIPRYVLKTADNIYINMAALGYWIKNELPMTKNIYLGRVVRRDEPVRNRDNPRYVPRIAFQDFVFPDYLNGPQYLFSADVMHRMAYVTRLVFPIAVEDAYIGLLCHRLEIRPIWDDNFHLLMKTTNVCVNAKLLFIFCKSAKEMSKLHKEIKNSEKYSLCKPMPHRGIHIGLWFL